MSHRVASRVAEYKFLNTYGLQTRISLFHKDFTHLSRSCGLKVNVQLCQFAITAGCTSLIRITDDACVYIAMTPVCHVTFQSVGFSN